MSKLALSVFLVAALAATGCSRLKPQTSHEAQPVIQKGWTFIEPEKELLSLDAGVDPVSYGGPVIAGEKIIFSSERFGLVALNRKSGQQVWRKPLDGALEAVPLVTDATVYAGTETGSVFALDVAGGKEKWQSMLSGPVHGSFLLAYQRLYVGTSDEAIHCLDPATGKVLWTYRRAGSGGTSVHGGGEPGRRERENLGGLRRWQPACPQSRYGRGGSREEFPRQP